MILVGNMFYIYIICSDINTKYYVGCSGDLEKRLSEHNKGLSKYTKRFKPWRLVYEETFKTLSNARKRETQIKSWKKRRAIEKLIGPFV